MGAEPDQDALLSERGAQTYIAEARHDDVGVQLRVTGGGQRIDWLLGTFAPLSGSAIPNPIAGEVVEFTPALVELAAKHAELGLAAARLAVGAVLLHPVGSLEEGYQSLAGFLTGIDILPQSSDFLYRINRPGTSRVVEGLKLNRLSEWSVAQMLSVTLRPDDLQTSNPQSEFLVRAGIDLNTPPTVDADLRGDLQQQLVGELLEEAMEISRKGNA